MKTKSNSSFLSVVFEMLTTVFVLTMVFWCIVGQSYENARIVRVVPPGYTCTLRSNIANPCFGTCPIEQRCRMNASDMCDCIDV
jgi:hypothetical protein